VSRWFMEVMCFCSLVTTKISLPFIYHNFSWVE
jgi:hypothetical protein